MAHRAHEAGQNERDFGVTSSTKMPAERKGKNAAYASLVMPWQIAWWHSIPVPLGICMPGKRHHTAIMATSEEVEGEACTLFGSVYGMCVSVRMTVCKKSSCSTTPVTFTAPDNVTLSPTTRGLTMTCTCLGLCRMHPADMHASLTIWLLFASPSRSRSIAQSEGTCTQASQSGALSASRDEGHHSWISLASQQEMSAPSCSRCITAIM